MNVIRHKFQYETPFDLNINDRHGFYYQYSFWVHDSVLSAFEEELDSGPSLYRLTLLSEIVINETTDLIVKCSHPMATIVDGFFANQGTSEDMYG